MKSMPIRILNSTSCAGALAIMMPAAVFADDLPAAIPEDRELVYPFIELAIIEDEFETSKNRDQIGKTEDSFLGSRFSASAAPCL